MRILIIQTAFLGDVVLTLPLIEAVDQRFPTAEIEVLTVPAHAAVLAGQPRIREVLTYDKRGRERGVRGLVRMMGQVRSRGYDVVVSPHRSLRSACLAAASGSAQRVGFRQWLTGWAYTATVTRPARGHEVEKNHQLMVGLDGETGLPPREPGPPGGGLQVAAAAQQQARQDFAARGLTGSETLIGLIPGSQWGTKRWPAESFAALIHHFATVPTPARCALFGGPQDRPIADAIIAAGPPAVIDLVGQTSLGALPAYLDRCQVVVSNDTGPMHIAAALGKPVVAIFGPTTPALGFSPYGVEWEEAGVALACRPCHAHGPSRCPLTHWRCMRELSPQLVAEKTLRLLRQDPAGSGATS